MWFHTVLVAGTADLPLNLIVVVWLYGNVYASQPIALNVMQQARVESAEKTVKQHWQGSMSDSGPLEGVHP